MPHYIEDKCCTTENMSRTYLSNHAENQCVLHSEEITHLVGRVNVRCAWLRQRRYQGFTNQGLAFDNMTNENYRYHAYRCYIDYMHGLLGQYNRKVIPACVVTAIRRMYGNEDNNYTGYRHVNEHGEEVDLDELAELCKLHHGLFDKYTFGNNPCTGCEQFILRHTDSAHIT